MLVVLINLQIILHPPYADLPIKINVFPYVAFLQSGVDLVSFNYIHGAAISGAREYWE
jgi:hypothetical protein